MTIKSGSGRKAKTENVEKEIITELETQNYHTRQQIVDMVKEKYHISISRSTAGRLLKKRVKMAEKQFVSRKGRHYSAKRFL